MSEELQYDLEVAILKETVKQQQQEIHTLQMRIKELVKEKEQLVFKLLEEEYLRNSY